MVLIFPTRRNNKVTARTLAALIPPGRWNKAGGDLSLIWRHKIPCWKSQRAPAESINTNYPPPLKARINSTPRHHYQTADKMLESHRPVLWLASNTHTHTHTHTHRDTCRRSALETAAKPITHSLIYSWAACSRDHQATGVPTCRDSATNWAQIYLSPTPPPHHPTGPWKGDNTPTCTTLPVHILQRENKTYNGGVWQPRRFTWGCSLKIRAN